MLETIVRISLEAWNVKKRIIRVPVDITIFSAENVLKQMYEDKAELIREWGKEKYHQRLKLLKNYIAFKLK